MGMRFWSILLVVAFVITGGLGFVTWSMPSWTLAASERTWRRPIQAGDLVFQDFDCGPRCELIRRVTRTHYTHVGIVLEDDGELVVWEAYGPVAPTPLAEWVRRGHGGKVAVYELRPQHLAQLDRIAAHVRALRGLPYDADYQWDDARLYCSELVAKAINRGVDRAIIIARPVGELGDAEELIAKMTSGRLTPRTLVVSPYDLIKSGALLRVVDEIHPPQLAELIAAHRSVTLGGCVPPGPPSASCSSLQRPTLLLP